MSRKTARILLTLLILLLLAFGYSFLRDRLPVVTGYAAKNMCSCVFVAGRSPESVLAEDLAFSPIRYARVRVDRAERSVTSTILGLASRKAVFREGLGCTLLVDTTEEALREQAAGYRPPAVLPANPDTVDWPMGDRLPDTLPPGLDAARLQAALAAAFDRHGPGTRGVVVVYRGQLVGEAYAPGFDAATPQLGWSMTKSLTSALIGILVGEGKLSLDQPAGFSDWQDDARAGITLDDLLRMSSGLHWLEEYGDLTDATRMLYLHGDMARYTRLRPLHSDPGTEWVYASGTTNLLQAIIRREVGGLHDYWAFPRRALFNRLGMRSVIIEPDASGMLVGSSYGFATPRDWARFGLLYLNDGVWQGERILPEGWVRYTRETTPASAGEYGAQFWLNQSGKLPDAPRDVYACQGFQGQRIFVVPSHELVVVRLGLSDEDTYDFNGFLKEMLEAVEGR